MAQSPLSVEERERTAVNLHAVLEQKLLDKLRPPNLIGVGTARAATTFLYGLLRRQPDVYATPVKETNYFAIASRRRMTLREYQLLFMGQTDQAHIADITPAYLHHPGAMEAIAAALDRPRIIINLREPVDRLISHYKYDKARHGCADLQIYLTVAMEQGLRPKGWIAPGRGVLLSLYAEAIERAFDLFGRERVCILAYDDVDPDGRRWLAQLSAFLGTPLAPVAADDRYNNATDRRPTPLPDTEAAKDIVAQFEADAARLRKLIGSDLVDRWAAVRRS